MIRLQTFDVCHQTPAIRYTRDEAMGAKNREPYQQAYYPPVPTRFTRYMRTSLVWQLIRFIIINVKILKLMMKAHKVHKV